MYHTWWFQIFIYVHPYLVEMIQFDYFFKGVETTN